MKRMFKLSDGISRSLLMSALGLAMGMSAQAATINYPGFSSLSGLQLNGSTASIGNPVLTGDGRVLRLTDGLGQSGSAFSQTPIALNNQNSFSTYFSFRISNPMGWGDGDGQGADGLVFVVQTVANNVGGGGGGIGYEGINKSVGIEFDTWDNGYWDGNDGNHVGIDLNGSVTSQTQTHIATRMNDGNRWYSWVDYNGNTDLLEVRLSQSNVRPSLSTLAYNVDLGTVLGSPNAFVGFTSGTGAAGGDHDIIEWQFRDTYNPVSTPDSGSTMAFLLMGFGALTLASRRCAMQRD